MLQRRFGRRSPQYPLESADIGVHGFYQYLTEYFGDVRSIHVAPLSDYSRQILLQLRPDQVVVQRCTITSLARALNTTRNLVVLLDSLIIA